MTIESGRYDVSSAMIAADGWSINRLTRPCRLYGANGIRAGQDGRIYLAQAMGSQISAVDPDSGAISVISPRGGPVIGPDDLAFDEQGNIYATEISMGRVSMLRPNGTYRVIHGEVPMANPITFHQGRLIAGEWRIGAQIRELDRDGGAPRVIADNVPTPNAFEVGPDGKLYFPVQTINEIWRVDIAGGEPEVVARGLGVPDSVKFDSKGFIVSTQIGSGQVLRIDPRTGDKTVLAQLNPGLDNCTFLGDRLFVSNVNGFIVEIMADGQVREIVSGGFVGPMGLACGADGRLFICDRLFSYLLAPGGAPEIASYFLQEGFPGMARGGACAGPGEYVVTTVDGKVVRFWPAERRSENVVEGLDQPFGIAVGPDGAIAVAEHGTGRVVSVGTGEAEVLAAGLESPKDVAFDAGGICYISEFGAGRVVRLARGGSECVLDGLVAPEGIAVSGGGLFVLDAGARELVEHDLGGGGRRAIASGLPVGEPPGVEPDMFDRTGAMPGTMGRFAAIASAADGTIYVSADGEGSIIALRPGGGPG